jgi:hypothetical protein
MSKRSVYISNIIMSGDVMPSSEDPDTSRSLWYHHLLKDNIIHIYIRENLQSHMVYI